MRDGGRCRPTMFAKQVSRRWIVAMPRRGRGGAAGRANSKRDLVTGSIRGFCALQVPDHNVDRRACSPRTVGGWWHRQSVPAGSDTRGVESRCHFRWETTLNLGTRRVHLMHRVKTCGTAPLAGSGVHPRYQATSSRARVRQARSQPSQGPPRARPPPSPRGRDR